MSNYLHSLSQNLNDFASKFNYFKSNEKAKRAVEDTAVVCEIGSSVLKVCEKMEKEAANPSKDIHQQITLWDEDLKKISESTERFRTGKKKQPFETLLNDFEQLKVDTKRTLKKLKNETEKISAVIDVLENASQLVERSENKKVKEYSALKKEINEEVTQLKKYLNDYYDAVMKETKTGRKQAVKVLNQTMGSDFKSRSLTKAIEISYKAGKILRKPDKEMDEAITLTFEVNKVKNSFMKYVSDAIMDPKKSARETYNKILKEIDNP
jgi:hypothetical protein